MGVDRLRRSHRAHAPDPLGQGLPLEELHDDVSVPLIGGHDVEDAHDVVALDARGDARLADEALATDAERRGSTPGRRTLTATREPRPRWSAS